MFSKSSIKNKKAFFLGTEADLIDNLIYEVNVTTKIEELIGTTFEYQGQIRTVKMNYDPGNAIRIKTVTKVYAVE